MKLRCFVSRLLVFWFLFVGLLVAMPGQAAMSTSFKMGDLMARLNSSGHITSIRDSNNQEYLPSGKSPALLSFIVADAASSAASTATKYTPQSISFSRGIYTLNYAGGLRATVAVSEQAGYTTFKLETVTKPSNKDVRVAIWGPYETTIHNQVADVVGVVYGRDIAIGIQGLNEKTIGGFPVEYYVLSYRLDAIEGGRNRPRVARNVLYISPAWVTNFGSVLQAFTRDFTVPRIGQGFIYDQGYTNDRIVTALSGDIGVLAGSGIALFGIERSGVEKPRLGKSRRDIFKEEILAVIHQVELAEGLPYTTADGGKWAKLAEGSRQRYMSPGNITSSNVSTRAAHVRQAGVRYLYDWSWSNGVFHGGDPFDINSDYGGTDAGLSTAINTARQHGLGVGTHFFTGFVFVAPDSLSEATTALTIPSDLIIREYPGKLLERARSSLINSINANQTDGIVISNRIPFTKKDFEQYNNTCACLDYDNYSATCGCHPVPIPVAYIHVGDEIITYSGVSDVTDGIQLTGVTRGVFGTTITAHSAQAPARALKYWGGYNAFSLGYEGAADAGSSLATRINNTGLGFLSFDGAEGISDDPHGTVALNVFFKSLFDNLSSKELSGEVSVLNQYNWHMMNRMSWGEGGGNVLQVHTRYRISNSIFSARNFLPTSLAGYSIGSDQANKDDEVHWIGSKVAALDGQAYFRFGDDLTNSRSELDILGTWMPAIEAGAFSDKDRLLMQHYATTASLQSVEDSRGRRHWKLSRVPLVITYDPEVTFTDSKIKAWNYGTATNPRHIFPPWGGHPTRNIAGDALVTTSSVADNSYHGDNVVDGFAGIDWDEIRGTNQSGTSEWATSSSDTTREVRLTWDKPQTIQQIILFDRALPSKQVTSGTIEFSDGTRHTFGALPAHGGPYYHRVPDIEADWVKVTLNDFDGTNPGLAEIGVIARTPENKFGNLASDATVISGYNGDGSKIFDGDIDSTHPKFIDLGQGVTSMVIDLGAEYMVDGLNVWRYHNDFATDPRTYHDVVYQLSTTSDFTSDVTTVFNNDADNSAGYGSGTDAEYSESTDGKPVFFFPVKARYVRLVSNGNSSNPNNHYAEVEVYGKKNLADGITPTTDGNVGDASRATDNDYSTLNHWDIGTGKRYVQLDLGSAKVIDSIRTWRFFGDSRRYHDVVIQVSNDSTFTSGVTTVFNNDLDNSSSLGTGTDGEYFELPSGKAIYFSPIAARYVRLYSNGSTRNMSNHYVEIQVGELLRPIGEGIACPVG